MTVSFQTDLLPGERQTVDVTGLRGGAPDPACPATASIIYTTNPAGIRRTVYIQIGSCPSGGLPDPVAGVKLAKSGADVELSWDEPSPAEVDTTAYHVWKVMNGDKRLIPDADHLAERSLPAAIKCGAGDCAGDVPRAAPNCRDRNELSSGVPRVVFYQVRGACGGYEGPEHP